MRGKLTDVFQNFGEAEKNVESCRLLFSIVRKFFQTNIDTFFQRVDFAEGELRMCLVYRHESTK